MDQPSAADLPQCPRCQDTRLTVLPQQTEDLSSLQCPRCERQWMLRAADLLTERWLGPLSLLLYPIVYSSEPLDDIERAVSHLVTAEGWPLQKLQWAVNEAELELAEPCQQVSKILNFTDEPSEELVREYLRRVIEQLKKTELFQQAT
jgi:hypothetical protein